MEEAHSQPEPAKPADPPVDPGNLTLKQVLINSQEWLSQKIAEMPELDSPGFWQWVEQPTPGKVAEPGALAWAMQQFAQRDQPAKTERVFNTLLLIFEKRALQLARSNKYVNLAANARSEMAEDVALLAWQELYRRLVDKARPLLPLYNFAAYFQKIIYTKGRDLALANGLISRVNPTKGKTAETTSPNGVQKANPKTTIAYNLPAQSLDAPISKNGLSSEDLSLGSLIADQSATADFAEIETIEIYKELVSRLASDEIEILSLRLDGYNISEIARALNRDWQTVERRLKSIREKAGPLEAVQRIEARRKVGRPAKAR